VTVEGADRTRASEVRGTDAGSVAVRQWCGTTPVVVGDRATQCVSRSSVRVHGRRFRELAPSGVSTLSTLLYSFLEISGEVEGERSAWKVWTDFSSVMPQRFMV